MITAVRPRPGDYRIVAVLLAVLATGYVLTGKAQTVTPAPRTPVDVSKLGSQVGERVPDFSLKDQEGTTRTLSSIMGPNGAMIVFYRSADW
ncbi:MAG TPA: hypothetical protein VMO26_13735 [Vicinamibacterales bacterium]|nr:hypothetical protein [Vicinamibacterales bacterium]